MPKYVSDIHISNIKQSEMNIIDYRPLRIFLQKSINFCVRNRVRCARPLNKSIRVFNISIYIYIYIYNLDKRQPPPGFRHPPPPLYITVIYLIYAS